MGRFRRWLVVLILAAGFPVAALAQPAVSAHAGGLWFSDERLFDVPHVLAGAAWQPRISRRITLGPEVTYMRGPGKDRDLTMLGLMRVDLGSMTTDRQVVPYFLLGGGILRHEGEFLPRRKSAVYGPHVTTGFGVRVKSGERWHIAPEFRFGLEFHGQVAVNVGIAR